MKKIKCREVIVSKRSEYIMQDKNRLKEVIWIIANETKLGILLSLQFYNSLNLKQIARIAGIREPSAFEHIKGRGKKGSEKGLLELGLIEEDKLQIGRGKFYQLTELAHQLFSNINAGIKGEQEFNFNDSKNIGVVIDFTKSVAIIAKNFAIYTANIIEQQVAKDDTNIQEKYKDKIYINFSHLNLTTIEQKKKLNEIFTQFGQAIHELYKESEKSSESEIDEKYFIYNFSTSLTSIDPREQHK